MNRTVKTGIVVAVISTVLLGIASASADYVSRFAASDAPPLEGKKEAATALMSLIAEMHNVATEAQSDTIELRLEAAWAMICAAKHTNTLPSVGGAQIEYARLQERHIHLRGNSYQLGDCP